MDVYEDLYKAKRVTTARIAEPDDFVIDFVPVLRKSGVRRVLDVGCGAGRNTIFLADEGFYMVGLDISGTALKLASERAARVNLRNRFFIRSDFLELPFSGSQFDAVISCFSIENQSLSKIQEALNEIKRVLINEGLVLATLHSTKHWRFGLGDEVEPRTFLATEKIKGKKFRFTAHFFEKHDVERLVGNVKLNVVSIKERIRVSDKKRVHWIVIAEKGIC